MSLFSNAQHTPIRIQDAMLIAVGGDQNHHANGSVTVAGPQHIAGNQNIYQGLPLKGTSSPPMRLSLIFLTLE